MKLVVYTVLVADRSLEDASKYLTSKGIHVVELGSGGYSGTAHANPDELLHDEKKLIAMHGIQQGAIHLAIQPWPARQI